MKKNLFLALALIAALIGFEPIAQAACPTAVGTQSCINRGTTAGDGTGETLFSAFGKVNGNFTDLYVWKATQGQANGLAPLDANSHVPAANLGNLTTNGFAPLGLQVTAGVPGTALVDAAGNSPAALAAQWIPRTGTLASLITLSGNPGEIAHATDVDALISYNGTIGGAKAYIRQRPVVGEFVATIDGDTVGSGTGTFTLNASSADSLPKWTVTGNYDAALLGSDGMSLLLPNTNGQSGALMLEIDGSLQFGSGTATPNAAAVVVVLQAQFSAGVWTTVASKTTPLMSVVNGVSSYTGKQAINFRFVYRPVGTPLSVRLNFKQASAGTGTLGDVVGGADYMRVRWRLDK